MGGATVDGRDAVRGSWTMDFPGHAPERLFALAADIESYPRFVPWCIATRILSRQADHWRCDNVFGSGPIRLRFHSRAEIHPCHAIDITSQDGPFRWFHLAWRFLPLADGARVEVGFEARFKWEIVGLLARVSLAEVERRVVAAFRRRAEHLTG